MNSILPKHHVKRLSKLLSMEYDQVEINLNKDFDVLPNLINPIVNEVLKNDVLVDDCVTGEDYHQYTLKRSDKLEIVTESGSFNLKGITMSGERPPSHLTENGVSVDVGGMKWFSKSDEVSVNIGELNFSTKKREKRLQALQMLYQ